jgi:hypothetical protein
MYSSWLLWPQTSGESCKEAVRAGQAAPTTAGIAQGSTSMLLWWLRSGT